MPDIFELIDLAKKEVKFSFMDAKHPVTELVAKCNVVEFNCRFYALLSSGVFGSNITAIDITDGKKEFDETLSEYGFVWNDVVSPRVPNILFLTALRAEQLEATSIGHDTADDISGDRLLLSRIQ